MDITLAVGSSHSHFIDSLSFARLHLIGNYREMLNP